MPTQSLIVPKDSHFRKTRVLPFIGQDYGRVMPWGLPIFVLGESHYSGIPLYSTFTRDVVSEMLNGVNYPFFTKAAGVFYGDWPDLEMRRKFWQTAAFYNFVQESVGDTARIRPTERMWREAAPALEETLMLCMPGFVLVLGKELWDNLPIPLRDGPEVKLGNGERKQSRLYFNDNGYAFTFGINHPCSPGWTYKKWTPWVKAALVTAINFQNG